MNFLIGEYVKKITEEDIYNFALNEGVKLLDYETKVIYSYIKKYWKVFINDDPTYLFKEIKFKVRNEVYDKIIKLYDKYKRQFIKR